MSSKTLTIAILGDTHGALDARVAGVVRRCDWAIHTGDIGGFQVLQALQPKEGIVRAVRGNNDTKASWHKEDLAILESLPWEIRLEVPGGDLVVVHGHRHNPAKTRHAKFRRRYEDAGAVIYGHSHQFLADQEESPWILNPGAAGRIRTFGGPTCLVLHASEEDWKIEAFRFPLHQRPGYKRLRKPRKDQSGSAGSD